MMPVFDERQLAYDGMGKEEASAIKTSELLSYTGRAAVFQQ